MQGILQIAVLCVLIGAASIPVSFTVNSSPIVVWLGNALGSLFSAFFVIFISERITRKSFRTKMRRHRYSKKVVTLYDEGEDNKKIKKAGGYINKHGLKVFSFLCPIFPGTLIATITVYLLHLDTRIYKRWMFAGVFFASGAYVFGYWLVFVK
jgi:hypothetical protein